MAAIEFLLFVVVLAAASRWVIAPVRAARLPIAPPVDLATLEAEREARLAAIRDAELDVQTGKLSAEDHRALDARLRAEAQAALDALDAALTPREASR